MSYRLIDIVQRLGTPRILVLGDLILDRYTWGDAERISQEAPVILLREDRQEARLGGAASVANLLRGLDADVTLAGVVGADPEAAQLREQLKTAGIDCAGLMTDESRPTTVKVRYLGRAQYRHPHQMLRVDREVRAPLNDEAAARLLERLLPQIGSSDAVLISDYAKGVCTPGVLSAVIETARAEGIPVIVDPASSVDHRRYAGATAVTPNRLEAGRAAGTEIGRPAEACAVARTLLQQLQVQSVFVTLDRDGMAVATDDGRAELLPTRRREVYDITGAGDMVLATIGIGAAARLGPVDLARLANIAGGLEVERIGVVSVTREEMLADLLAEGRSTTDKIGRLDEVARHAAARRKLGQRIVFTNGCFDLLHPGHVQFLQEASSHGDCLVVAINSDRSVRKNKGVGRPIIGERDRSVMLAALECVDHVLVFDEATPHAVLRRLQPDVLVKGGTTPYVVAHEVVESYGGEVRTLATVPDFSTTNLIEAIAGSRDAA